MNDAESKDTYAHLPNELLVYYLELERRYSDSPEDLWERFWDGLLHSATPLLWKANIYPQSDAVRKAQWENFHRVMEVAGLYAKRFNSLYGMPLDGPENLDHFLTHAPLRYIGLN